MQGRCHELDGKVRPKVTFANVGLSSIVGRGDVCLTITAFSDSLLRLAALALNLVASKDCERYSND